MQIYIVLVSSQNSGNIGAIARSMMNMGFHNLRLVTPEVSHVSKEALDRAVSAKPILTKAKVYLSLSDALVDCTTIVGSSGRPKDIRISCTTPREWALTTKTMKDKKIALVFGPEDRGLSNEELLLCDEVIEIPSSPEFPSLNLSHAVMIMLYELKLAMGGVLPKFKKDFSDVDKKEMTLASLKDREGFYGHLQEMLLSVEFLHNENPVHIMRDLRNIYSRAKLTKREVAILRGICRRIIKRKK